MIHKKYILFHKVEIIYRGIKIKFDYEEEGG